MIKSVKREVIDFQDETFIVDLWELYGKYNAHAQQIYVDGYRVGHAEGLPTESIAEFVVIRAIQKRYK